MKKLFSVVLSLLLVWNPAFAEGQGPNRSDQARALIRQLVDRPMPLGAHLQLASSAGATNEDLMEIKKIYEAKSGSSTKTKITFQDDKFFANGKFTGIGVSSYAPFEVTVNGNIWRLNKNKPISANYHSLMQAIQGGQKSASHFLFPSAYAADGSPIIAGLFATFVVASAVVLTGLAISSTPLVALAVTATTVGIAGSFVIGGAVIAVTEWKDKNKTDKLLKANFEVQCGPDEIILADTGSKSTVVIKRSTEHISVQQNGKSLSGNVVSAEQSKAFIAMAASCKNEQDAKELEKSMRSAAIAAETTLNGKAGGSLEADPAKTVK